MEKGAQSRLLHKQFDCHLISVGQILRKMSTTDQPVAAIIREAFREGKLVDSKIINQAVVKEIQTNTSKDILLDGFLRNIEQAKFLRQNHLHIHLILYFVISPKMLWKRLLARLIHPASGRTYHEMDAPPQKAGLDDLTGEPLFPYSHETEEMMKERISLYEQEIMQALSFYRLLPTLIAPINADQPIAAVNHYCQNILEYLQKK